MILILKKLFHYNKRNYGYYKFKQKISRVYKSSIIRTKILGDNSQSSIAEVNCRGETAEAPVVEQ